MGNFKLKKAAIIKLIMIFDAQGHSKNVIANDIGVSISFV